jgi:hypothetical protein
MRNMALSLLEVVVLAGLAIVIACFVAGIGGMIRYTTRPPGTRISVYWLMRLGMFAGIPFGIIGMTSGYMTGISRVGAVSAMVPAGLTLVGGVGVYLFGKGGKAAVLAAFAVINFAIMTLTGALIGGYERLESEQVQHSFESAKEEVNKEFLLRQYRHSLGLEDCTGKNCKGEAGGSSAVNPVKQDE